MIMPASSEFVDLCQAQIALLTQALGAALSAVYLTEELAQEEETKLTRVVVYPEKSAVWADRVSLVLLPDKKIEKANDVRRLLSAAPREKSMLVESGADGKESDRSQNELDNSPLQQRQIILPLIYEGMVMGLLVTGREDRPWSDRERLQIERIADTIAIACILDRRGQWLSQQFTQHQRLDSDRNDLLHDLLHQLRNPLTALRTFGKLLLKRLRPGDGNRDVAAGIVRESDRIQDLLERFDEAIDLRVGGELRPGYPFQVPDEPVSSPVVNKLLLLPEGGLMAMTGLTTCFVAEILEPLILSAYAIAQERSLESIVDIPDNLPPVRANYKGLREIFSNLLDNALKYTPSGGRIYVEAGRSRESPQGRWQGVAVSDTGPGIPPQDLERLFERHYRGVQAQTGIPGTGLGLAIARDLVRQMGGEIEVFSPSKYPANNNGGVGTTFIVWLLES